MAEANQNTEPQNPGGTGGDQPGGQPPADQPTVTPPQNGGGAASGDDEMVTMSKADRDALVAARDRANNTVQDQSGFIESMAQKEGITNFLKDNKQKYPDLSFDDLKHIEDPADLDNEAARLQRRLEDHAQSKILEIENHQPPQETAEQRAQREAELRKNPSPESHLAFLAGRLN